MGEKKLDLLQELTGDRLDGATISQLANYSELFQKIAEAVFLLDRNSGRVIECNPAARALLGLEEAQIVGKELIEIMKFNPDETGILGTALGQFKTQPDFQFHQELEWHNDQGKQYFFELTASTLKVLNYIEVIQVIANDNTQLRFLERDLQDVNEVLEHLEQERQIAAYGNPQSGTNGAPGITKKSA